MTQLPEQKKTITVFAQTNYRSKLAPFGIKQADRRAHIYVLGKTGTGKSTLIQRLVLDDITAGRGIALFDPHGDLLQSILANLPKERQSDIVYFDVPDNHQELGFNPLSGVPTTKKALAASGLLGVFKKIWSDSWGPRLEHILRNSLLALLDQPEATLADILKLLSNQLFRKTVIKNIRNEQVRSFWALEYEDYPARFRAEAIAPIQNKVGAFLADPILNRILTQPKSVLNFRQIMDEGKILLVNLAKGKLGEDTSSLLGSLLVSSIGLAALRRADTVEDDRRDFHLYLDEFHNFTTLSLAGMLSELRKYRLNLILAHQYLSQLDPQVRDAILGNVGTLLCFRVGLTDAELLEGEFYPDFRARDLINLPNFHVYMKMMIDGRVSNPFCAQTFPPAVAA